MKALTPKQKENLSYLIIISMGLCCAYFSVGFHHPDEHFSVLELMNWKKGDTSWNQFNWDVQRYMRPFLLPGLLYFYSSFLDFITVTNPFTQAFLFRVTAFFLGFYSLYLLVQNISLKENKPLSHKLLFLYSIWFVPFILVRVSSESVAASLFFLAITFALKKQNLSSLLAGLLLGLSFNVRFQMGIACAGLFLWLLFIDKRSLKSLFLISLGLFVTLCLGVLIDRWGYGLWTFTPWNYLKINLLENKVNSFGTSPIYFYLTKNIVKGFPPLSLFLILSSIFFWIKKPKHILTFTVLPFIIIHSLIGHKEIRFLFFVYLLTPLFLLFFKQRLVNHSKALRLFWKFSYAINLIVLIKVLFSPAHRPIHAYSFIYDHVPAHQEILTPIQDNQKHLELEMPFYTKDRRTLKEMTWESIRKSDQDKFWLITSQYNEREKVPNHCNISYSLYPSWLLQFNFFKWRDRSSIWTIYRCRG